MVLKDLSPSTECWPLEKSRPRKIGSFLASFNFFVRKLRNEGYLSVYYVKANPDGDD
jgi:hypothetical protein